jgi:hypothetical protein
MGIYFGGGRIRETVTIVTKYPYESVLGCPQINADYKKRAVGIHHILKVFSLTVMTVFNVLAEKPAFS